MFGIRYLKTSSTNYVLLSRNGRIVRQGPGLSFFYFAPTSVIARVPISTIDVPFAFTEASVDFQEVVVQGTLTYRISQPQKLALLLDHTIDHLGRYQSDDPTKLSERLVQTAQAGARRFVQTQSLRAVLVSSAALGEAISAALQESTIVTQLGVEVFDVAVTSIQPNPEMAKALQSEAREQLLKEADEAIYARRNSAVELERTIRENELTTERVVVQRQREIRETEMQAEIAVEQHRTELVEKRVENQRKEAEARGEALRVMLDPVRGVDWKTLLAMQGRTESAAVISSAFEELARGAEKIGTLNVSPDLLQTLLQPMHGNSLAASNAGSSEKGNEKGHSKRG